MKHRRHGVKREHSVIGEFPAVFERLARLTGVAAVIPGRIASNPTRHPGLVLKGETPTGFKLLAKTTNSIQEVFVTVRSQARATALEGLRGMVTRPLPARPAAPPAPRRQGTPRERPPRPWRNPGILPEGRERGDPVRYAVDERGRHASARGAWAPAAASVGESVRDAPVRRRLLVLRLRRARWRHRFAAPLRLAPRPPRRKK